VPGEVTQPTESAQADVGPVTSPGVYTEIFLKMVLDKQQGRLRDPAVL